MSAVTDILGTRYPFIQAPMNWMTNPVFVAAVANAGGLGVVGTNAGQTTVTTDPVGTAERTRAAIRGTRELTDKPIGLNLLVAPGNEFSERTLEVALEEGIEAYVTIGEPDADTFRRIQDSGAVIIHRPLNPTLEELRRAEDFGADLIVATGYDEGGITPTVSTGTFSIVPTFVDAARVPVIAAGAINDARGVAAAQALGAQGVFVGTRLMVTRESPLADSAKQAIINATGWDVDWVAPSRRSVLTPYARGLAEQYHSDGDAEAASARLVDSGAVRVGMVDGDLEAGIISVNTAISLIHDEPSVAELIERMMTGWREHA
ncbi:nitronate monooxygenase [Actinomyces sp. ZJ308]|uniref:NAD(P)H-dependent flavin oxidoreductase n=1 Tax=Actinomyces sp. ZJ308 TaxID=2708342 RepID=UPI002443A6C4|nr:nitronate monooxygenase [Actinomyces sp. ZJ308]